VSGPVSTPHPSAQTVRDWVAEHNQALDGESPDADELTTEWTSQAGPEKVVTEREPSEDDATFLGRHQAEYMLEMLEAPPAV